MMDEENPNPPRPPHILKGSREWKRMEEELKKFREEEERPTLKTFNRLKKSLCQVNRENVRKEEVIRRLTARLSKQATRRVGEGGNGVVKQAEELIVVVVPDVEVDAAEIFPVEIWEMILDKVVDPRDLLNCYSACPLFRELLHQWKTTWEFEQALPHLFAYIPTNKLVQCRLISNGWKETVDDFFRNHPSLRPHDETTCNPRLLPFISAQKESGMNGENTFCFDIDKPSGEMPDLQDPMYVQTTRRNLIMWRTACLVILFNPDAGVENRATIEEFWNKIYTFMETFGKYIWYLTVEFEITTESRLTMQRMSRLLFADLLTFVPNLRKFTIGHFVCGDIPEAYMAMNLDSLPPLPNLETMETVMFFAGEGQEYQPLMLGMVRRYHTQLRGLRLDDSDSFWTEGYELAWPKLTELHLTVGTLGHLSRLTRMEMPNLTKLGLVLFPMVDPDLPEDENLPTLLQILTELSSVTRLSTLRLDGSIIQELKVLERVPVAASMPPTLKTLELHYSKEGIIPHPDYSFLLYFPHLQHLNVFYSEDDGEVELVLRDRDELEADWLGQLPSRIEREVALKDREQEVVEVNKYVYTGQMYKSNIWELLPRLKLFTFQDAVYAREVYEVYRKKAMKRKNRIRKLKRFCLRVRNLVIGVSILVWLLLVWNIVRDMYF